MILVANVIIIFGNVTFYTIKSVQALINTNYLTLATITTSLTMLIVTTQRTIHVELVDTIRKVVQMIVLHFQDLKIVITANMMEWIAPLVPVLIAVRRLRLPPLTALTTKSCSRKAYQIATLESAPERKTLYSAVTLLTILPFKVISFFN